MGKIVFTKLTDADAYCFTNMNINWDSETGSYCSLLYNGNYQQSDASASLSVEMC